MQVLRVGTTATASQGIDSGLGLDEAIAIVIVAVGSTQILSSGLQDGADFRIGHSSRVGAPDQGRNGRNVWSGPECAVIAAGRGSVAAGDGGRLAQAVGNQELTIYPG